MGRNVDNIPWPKKGPKSPKKGGGSGKGNGTTVGMAVLFLAIPVSAIGTAAVYLLHGHGVI